jgi:hypothetical protein
LLGRMPTDHIVSMLAASPPQRAVTVLLAMPKDRIGKLLGVMDGRLIARMLIAADPGRRAALLTHLSDARLAAELALLPLVETARVLASLPGDRAAAQLERVAPEILTLLLDALPAAHQTRLAALLDPVRLVDLRRADYERTVIESLRRTAARLDWVPDVRGANLRAGVFQRLFGISLCYVDQGELPSRAVAAAQRVFVAEQVHGVLVISNAEPSLAASELLLDARYAQAPALVVTWGRDDNDGLLGRALVKLAG